MGHIKRLTMKKKDNNKTDGYPQYPAAEDIYAMNKEEDNIDPENLSMEKQPNEDAELIPTSKKKIVPDKSGEDLDVPGSELDDEQEAIGSEDEENNYYSLGGDEHNDMDEQNDQ